MSVAENIMLGHWPLRIGTIDRPEMQRRAALAVVRLAPHLSLSALARSLSPAEDQLVEIARAIAERLRVLIMNEPTPSLFGREIAQLFRVVRDLRIEVLGVVFVSHWLGEVFQIADRVTALRDGSLISNWPITEMTPDAVIGMTV